jgi:hypothetical protein
MHLVGDGIGLAALFYHSCLSGPTRFFIIFDGGSRITQIHRLLFPCPFFNLHNMLYDQCRPFSGVKKGSSASFAYGDTV